MVFRSKPPGISQLAMFDYRRVLRIDIRIFLNLESIWVVISAMKWLAVMDSGWDGKIIVFLITDHGIVLHPNILAEKTQLDVLLQVDCHDWLPWFWNPHFQMNPWRLKSTIQKGYVGLFWVIIQGPNTEVNISVTGGYHFVVHGWLVSSCNELQPALYPVILWDSVWYDQDITTNIWYPLVNIHSLRYWKWPFSSVRWFTH